MSETFVGARGSRAVSWRAATLGAPLWIMAIVPQFFVIAPIVDDIAPAFSDISVEFTSIIAVGALDTVVALTLFKRSKQAKWRGLAIGICTAAVLALEFGAIHFGVNINAKYSAAP